MNKKTIKTITKSVIIILILLAVVFALRAPASDLNLFDDSAKLEFVDDTGLPYFSEMDSYYNLRLTQNYIDHGYVGDIQYDNGTQWDMHRLAPDGVATNYQMGIVYVTSFLHSIANMFGSYSVKEVAFWTGAIIASLAVIPAFIFGRRLTNDYGAVVAALIVGLAPNYFAHTFPGFFDTDMFYYFLPLFFIFFFIEALRTDNKVHKIIFAILSVISIGLFSQCWSGYIFYIGVIVAFIVIFLIAKFLLYTDKGDKSTFSTRLKEVIHSKDFLTIVVLVVLGLIVIVAFNGLDFITGIFGSVTGLFGLQSATGGTGSAGFPNVYISVAEMQIPSLLGAGMGSAFLANSNGAVNGIGGIVVLFAAIFALYKLVRRVFALRKVKIGRESTAKPKNKAERKAASKKIDDKRKFNISLKNLGKFDDKNELYAVRRTNLIYASLFVAWVIVAIAAITQGSRFITTIVLPVALLTGIFVGDAVNYFKTKNVKDILAMIIVVVGAFLISYPLAQIMVLAGIAAFLLIIIVGAVAIYDVKGKIELSGDFKRYVLIAVVIFALISPTICGAYQTSNNVVPGTSDAMWNSMVWINNNAPEDTVITSWWDFGYLFEIAADRQTTFDGGSQSGERAFWLGKAMSTDDLELSAGIFRMLNTKGGAAVADLSEMGMDSGKSTELLCKILPLPASEAKTTLMDNYSFSEAQADKLLEDTHPENPRPTIFVASSDMLQKAGWWSYFGNWNFAEQNSTNYQYFLPTSQLTIAPGQSGVLNMLNDSGIAFNTVIDRNDGNTSAHTEATYANNGSQIMLNGSEYNPLKAGVAYIFEDGKLVSNSTVSEDGNYTLFVLGYTEDGTNGTSDSTYSYTVILVSNELAHSMFTRLFILGDGGDVFTRVHAEPGVTLWQVNYNNTAAGGSSK